MSDHANAARQPAVTSTKEIVISVRDLVVQFGEHRVMDGLDLDVFRSEVLGFVGGSGQGKSVLILINHNTGAEHISLSSPMRDLIGSQDSAVTSVDLQPYGVAVLTPEK